MKNATKATLLSALVFPGAGHIFLKKYMSGGVLIVFSFIAISYLINKITENALKVVGKIQTGYIPLDIQSITELITTQSTGTDIQVLDIATTVFILCWIIGIIDSYRVGLHIK